MIDDSMLVRIKAEAVRGTSDPNRLRSDVIDLVAEVERLNLQIEEYRKATLCSCAEDPLNAAVHLGDCAWKSPAIEKLHRDGLRRPTEKRVEPSSKCGLCDLPIESETHRDECLDICPDHGTLRPCRHCLSNQGR